MTTFSIKIPNSIHFISALFIVVGCQQFNENETNESAGLNGGFEISSNNLPVNWLMYTPNTVPNAEFEIILDKTDFKEGTQSLRFDVNSCSSTGGWHSPGFANQFPDIGDGIYKLSFWIKNRGTKFQVSAGGVAPNEGNMRTLIKSDQQLEEWTFYEYTINVPKERQLRMQLNILEPGIFWIDDVQIRKI